MVLSVTPIEDCVTDVAAVNLGVSPLRPLRLSKFFDPEKMLSRTLAGELNLSVGMRLDFLHVL